MASSSSNSSNARGGEVSSEALTVQFGLHLRSCLRDTASVWKQFWETSLVGHDHMTKLRLGNLKGSLPLVKAEVPALESFDEDFQEKSEGWRQICAKMAKFKHASWPAMQNEERNLAINKWLKIVLEEPLAFAVARNFYAGKASGALRGHSWRQHLGCPGFQGQCNAACKSERHAPGLAPKMYRRPSCGKGIPQSQRPYSWRGYVLWPVC